MAIKFKNTEMETFNEKKNAYMELMKSEDSAPEQLENAFDDMFNALQSDLTEKITQEARNEVQDAHILSARGENVLTSEERKFFNEAIEFGGFDEGSRLPVTTQERVCDDIKQEHPLRSAIGLKDLVAVTRFIYSDPNKAYAWGNLFGESKGQVSTAFSEEQIRHLKLT